MIVSNTTPLINFCTIDRLDILHKLFGIIHIPNAVYNEIQSKLIKFPLLQKLLNDEQLVIDFVQNKSIVSMLQIDLQEGESEAIALALENNAKTILLDEIAARKIAEYKNMNFIGTIGILDIAKQKGIIEQVKPILDEIIEKGCFWINVNLYNFILNKNDELS